MPAVHILRTSSPSAAPTRGLQSAAAVIFGPLPDFDSTGKIQKFLCRQNVRAAADFCNLPLQSTPVSSAPPIGPRAPAALRGSRVFCHDLRSVRHSGLEPSPALTIETRSVLFARHGGGGETLYMHLETYFQRDLTIVVRAPAGAGAWVVLAHWSFHARVHHPPSRRHTPRRPVSQPRVLPPFDPPAADGPGPSGIAPSAKAFGDLAQKATDRLGAAALKGS